MAASDQELEIQKTTAKRVRLFRTMRGISLAKMAKVCGCSFQQMQKCEQNRNRFPGARLKIIADFLEVPISALFDEAPPAMPATFSTKQGRAIAALATLETRAPQRHRALCELTPNAQSASNWQSKSIAA